MDKNTKILVDAFQQQFNIQLDEFRDQVTLLIEAKYIVEASRLLKEKFGFDRLSSITAVDYWPDDEPRFHVVYHYYSSTVNDYLCLRVPLAGDSPSIQTIETIFPNANWPEREVWDMFGIRFEGHSDMRRILMPFDWQGHPQRKDYPLGYEEVQFTFNFDDIDRHKSYAKD